MSRKIKSVKFAPQADEKDEEKLSSSKLERCRGHFLTPASLFDPVVDLLERNSAADQKITAVEIPLPDFSSSDTRPCSAHYSTRPLEASGSHRAMLLSDVCSPEECHALVKCTEEIGYREGQLGYRDNTRVVANIPGLASSLWKRIHSYLPRVRLPLADQPLGTATALHENIRFDKYTAAQSFGLHEDRGTLSTQHPKCTSVFSFVLYLNDSFEGGRTSFAWDKTSNSGQDKACRLELNPDRVCVQERSGISEDNAVYRVQPKIGSALVFRHALLHDGGQVTKGTKYIMRSDVLYQEVDPNEKSVVAND